MGSKIPLALDFAYSVGADSFCHANGKKTKKPLKGRLGLLLCLKRHLAPWVLADSLAQTAIGE